MEHTVELFATILTALTWLQTGDDYIQRKASVDKIRDADLKAAQHLARAYQLALGQAPVTLTRAYIARVRHKYRNIVR